MTALLLLRAHLHRGLVGQALPLRREGRWL